MDIVLTPVEARVLGSLMEKERTVPATYPLTMNALLTACNQTSSRDPLMAVSEDEAEAAIEALKAHRLVRRVLPSHGNRTVKYRHVVPDVLQLDAPQQALLTVLLLRGPQTPQELRTRTERLHPFPDATAVEEVLADMAGWGDPLVRLLPRRPGQRDARWAHLLAGEPDLAAPDPAPAAAAGPAAAAAPAPVAPPPEPIHGALGALAGTWVGVGQGRYPTVADFAYAEEVTIEPMPGKPRLSLRTRTRAADDGRGLHAESGFLRLTDDGGVEMVVATGAGIVEVSSGLVEVAPDGTVEVVLASEAVAGAPTAKEVTATERTYRVAGDVLTSTFSMAAVGQPMTPHLTAELRRTP
jgi:uncharacterized protein YceH (UPF0502 family)